MIEDTKLAKKALRIVIYRQRQRLEDIGCVFHNPLPKRFRELQQNDYNHY